MAEYLVEVPRKVEFEIQTKLPNLLRPGKKASVWRISNELVIEVGLDPTLSLDLDFLKSFFLWANKLIAVIHGPQNAMECVI